MKPGHIAIELKSRRLVQVFRVKGRIFDVAWFADVADAKVPEKLRTGKFWAHQLEFDADKVRARAKELGLDRPRGKAPGK